VGVGLGLAALLLVSTLEESSAAPVALAHVGLVAIAAWCFSPPGRWATAGLATIAWTAATLTPAVVGEAAIDPGRVARDGSLGFLTPAAVLATVGVGRRAVRSFTGVEGALAVTLLRERDPARRDRLTRLWNSRYLHEALEQEIARSRRYGRPFGLLVMDLDGFKASTTPAATSSATRSFRRWGGCSGRTAA
jgi:hypothetical protein